MHISPREILDLIGGDVYQHAKDWGGYELEWNPLAASASGARPTLTAAVDNDVDLFVALSLGALVTTNASPPVAISDTTPWLLMFQMITGTRQWFNNPVPLWAVAGSGKLPKWLDFPIGVAKTTQLNASMTNLDTSAYQIRLAVQGIRIFSVMKGPNILTF